MLSKSATFKCFCVYNMFKDLKNIFYKEVLIMNYINDFYLTD